MVEISFFLCPLDSTAGMCYNKISLGKEISL